MKQPQYDALVQELAEAKMGMISDGVSFKHICAVDKAYRRAERVADSIRESINIAQHAGVTSYTARKRRENAHDMGPEAA